MKRKGWMLDKRIWLLVASVWVAGCQSMGEKDENSPYYQVPVGSMLQLHRRIEIPGDYARVYFKDGRVSLGSGSPRPTCSLEVNKLSRDGSQFVEPGDFTVRRTQLMREEVAQQPIPVMLASLDLKLAGASVGSGGQAMIYEGYHLWLESPSQPNVMRLTCRGVINIAWEARRPSIAEIRAALGEIATLKLAD